MKPADAVVAAAGTVPYPPLTEDLHHEVEMVVAIGKGGANLSADKALEHVWGYAVGVDLTRRDLQAVAKKMSRPWDWAKGFDASAPCGPIVPVAVTGHPRTGSVSLSVNGEPRQQGDLNELIGRSRMLSPTSRKASHWRRATLSSPVRRQEWARCSRATGSAPL